MRQLWKSVPTTTILLWPAGLFCTQCLSASKIKFYMRGLFIPWLVWQCSKAKGPLWQKSPLKVSVNWWSLGSRPLMLCSCSQCGFDVHELRVTADVLFTHLSTQASPALYLSWNFQQPNKQICLFIFITQEKKNVLVDKMFKLYLLANQIIHLCDL